MFVQFLKVVVWATAIGVICWGVVQLLDAEPDINDCFFLRGVKNTLIGIALAVVMIGLTVGGVI